MALFQTWYDKAIVLSRHRLAEVYLGLLSFAESFFLPFPPPDVMLAPMSMASPHKAWRFATITLITSLIGGTCGYLLGVFAFDQVAPWISEAGYQPAFDKAQQWFLQYGIWIVFVAGFSPIPYKVFTIAAGVAAMAFLPFILASLLSRGARFFLVAALMKWGGAALESRLRQTIDWLGWAVVLVLIVVIIVVK